MTTVSEHWINLWNQIDHAKYEWKQPWFESLPCDIAEGNPAFSACSSSLKRGLRIIQRDSIQKGEEFYAYLDTFCDIQELVIACVPSDLTSQLVLALMNHWVAKDSTRSTGKEVEKTTSQESSLKRLVARFRAPQEWYEEES